MNTVETIERIRGYLKKTNVLLSRVVLGAVNAALTIVLDQLIIHYTKHTIVKFVMFILTMVCLFIFLRSIQLALLIIRDRRAVKRMLKFYESIVDKLPNEA